MARMHSVQMLTYDKHQLMLRPYSGCLQKIVYGYQASQHIICTTNEQLLLLQKNDSACEKSVCMNCFTNIFLFGKVPGYSQLNIQVEEAYALCTP